MRIDIEAEEYRIGVATLDDDWEIMDRGGVED